MKRLSGPRGLMAGLLAATVLLIAIDIVALHGFPFRQGPRFYELPVVDSVVAEAPVYEQAPREALGPPEPYTVMQPEPVETAKFIEEEPMPEEPKSVPVPEPEAPPVRHAGEPAKIVIIIDDVGMDRKHSKQAVELPGPLTLAFLPYAPKLDVLTGEAKTNGHELMIHMPMEAMDKRMNPGPIALRSGMSEAEMAEMLDKAFASFSGYVGLNNHMGSRMTQDETAMRLVMRKLKERNLLFVDSKTIGSSVAEKMAAEAGIKHAERDVFLDNANTIENVRKELRVLEHVADKKGYAVAIGHPKEATIQGLKEWLPGLKERGFELVPVSDIARRSKIAAAVSSVQPASGSSYYGPVRPPAQPPAEQPAPY